jgi:uncharacterized protein
MKLPENPKPGVRLLILAAGLIGLMVINYCFNKTIVPQDAQSAIVFQGGILFIILCSLFLEDKFTKPVDALVNALASFISIITIRYLTPPYWNLLAIYCVLVFCAASSCMVLGLPTDPKTKHPQISKSFYRFSIFFGKASIIYSIVFLYALLVFYGIQSKLTITLVIFWGIYLALWPLKIPHMIQWLFEKTDEVSEEIGAICRVESPGLIRVKVVEDVRWEGRHDIVACLPNNEIRRIYPLYSQFQEEISIGTGLLLDKLSPSIAKMRPGGVYKITGAVGEGSNIDSIIREYFRLNEDVRPIGLVVEGSNIGKIKFEIWNPTGCKEGMLVFCKINEEYVYYQIIEGTTHEETLEKDRHGFQIAHANQLGVLDEKGRFQKYPWVPSMNVPIFPAKEIKKPVKQASEDIIKIGKIPGSSIQVFADSKKLRVYHTAILGVTGTGKTEFAFDIIRENVKKKVKVFCVDLTALYKNRLQDLNPIELSIDDKLSDELGKKIHEVETGSYGATQEKKVLKEFSDRLRLDIEKKVKDFLENKDDYLGLFNLPTISNAKATIHATEIYLSAIFYYARSKSDSPEIMIVLEEAHTVIPETVTMGLGDRDSQGIIARIAQIALQGRKYGVGLLLIAQRTANVSKTVLSQCNTIFAFSTFDETGINYMANIFGRDFASVLPNLKFLQLIAYGKGILSDRPLIVELPFIPEKDEEYIKNMEMFS